MLAERSGTRLAGLLLIIGGVLGPVILLALRGGSSIWLAQVWTMAAIAGVGIAAVAMPRTEAEWASRAWMVLACCVAAVVLINLAFAWVDLDGWVWRAPFYIPANAPIGSDFRIGGYEPAQVFSTAKSGWPPFTLIMFTPYTWMSANTAYLVQTVVLLVANITTIATATVLAMGPKSARGPGEPHSSRSAVARLAPLMAVWLFASYGFLLSMNRANIDALVGLFAILGLASILRRPHDVWTPAILFALATQTKLYPAALLLLLVWRFRWRSILPIVLPNAILAFSAGPQNLWRFVHAVDGAVASGANWVGNSSAKSFSAWIDWVNPWYLPHVSERVLLAIPAAVFIFTAIRLWRRRDTGATVLMTCSLFTLMFSLPSVSHDYKLVLLTGPFLLLFGYIYRSASPIVERWWMLLALAVALFFCARAPGNMQIWTPSQIFVWPALLMNKYPSILLLQVIVAWMAWRLPALDDTRRSTEAAEVPQAALAGR